MSQDQLTKTGCGLVSFGCAFTLLSPLVVMVLMYLISLFDL